MDVSVGVRSDVGRVRENNQDAYAAEPPMFVVADGMGGHSAGDIASSMAVAFIADAAAADPAAMETEQLAALLQQANQAIWQRAKSAPELRGMGTTCTLLVVGSEQGKLAHVGDSRAYLLRSAELAQLTEDHSLVGRMVAEGKISEEEAAHHPARSTITRALGAEAQVKVDLTTFSIEPGDRLLLCTDGLFAYVDRAVIREVLMTMEAPQAAADRLVELANEVGGEDNVTAMVVDLQPTERGTSESLSLEPPSQPAKRSDTRLHDGRMQTLAPDAPPPGRSWFSTSARLVVAALILAVAAAVLLALLRGSG